MPRETGALACRHAMKGSGGVWTGRRAKRHLSQSQYTLTPYEEIQDGTKIKYTPDTRQYDDHTIEERKKAEELSINQKAKERRNMVNEMKIAKKKAEELELERQRLILIAGGKLEESDDEYEYYSEE